MKDLFVCSLGMKRSPMAKEVAKQLALRAGFEDYTADSAGVSNSVHLNLEDYDRIFVMDERIKEYIESLWKSSEKIIILDVSDQHSVSEAKFRELLRSELEAKLGKYF